MPGLSWYMIQTQILCKPWTMLTKIENDHACKMLTHVLFCLNLVMNKIIRKMMDSELSSRVRGHIIIYREKM